MSPTQQQPSLTKDDVLALRGDLSPYLIHLTRSGSCLLKADAFTDLPMDRILRLDARDSLINIINDRRLKARQAFGYFNYKVNVRRPNGTYTNPNSQIQRSWLRAVCFTETPVDHVHIQCKKILGRSLQFEPYGLAFFESCVRPQVNPVFYFDSSNTSLRGTFDGLAQDTNAENFKSFLPLVETFGKPIFRTNLADNIDFRWEREWRVPGDFNFQFSDVAYGLCKKQDIEYFENLVSHSFPFIDPTESMDIVKSKLRQWPKLKNLK